ncbi:MAG: 3-hydroxyacyl-ACP dehydratase FabZ [Candidatus Omnitrophica bacterium]|nr:3-hydroxyacyl-ACP dehydratase FabZ [Candidatus Omnitrophota bacterium]
MIIDIAQIQKIIPHRFPFLLIDRVIECEPNEKLVAIKNVSVNEPFFVGHFPEEKVMPGVLIVEAMAQAGCIYYYYSKNLQTTHNDLVFYLAKITAKFKAPVIPGDQLRIEVRSVKLLSKVGFFKAVGYVGDRIVAEAEIGFSVNTRK